MIKEYLRHGEENATSNEVLSRMNGTDTRTTREMVKRARLEGEPICASSKGYFLPGCEDDLKRTISRLYKMARETRKSAEAMKKNSELYFKSEEFKKMAEAMEKGGKE